LHFYSPVSHSQCLNYLGIHHHLGQFDRIIYVDLLLSKYPSLYMPEEPVHASLPTFGTIQASLPWVKWLRMQGHRLPATLEVTGSNPGPGKINLIEKNHQRDS
jgi:hypothetical protein